MSVGENEVFVCNDCDHFDIMTGLCELEQSYHHPLEEACDNFLDWNDVHD